MSILWTSSRPTKWQGLPVILALKPLLQREVALLAGKEYSQPGAVVLSFYMLTNLRHKIEV